MNLVGHVLAASWDHDDPRALFGAMLPDLASIAGVRLSPPRCERVDAGVAHHHRIDARFHELEAFADLRRETREALVKRGVSKGPREAVAHAGVELLLDGALFERSDARRAYEAAGRAARELSHVDAGWVSRESFIIVTGRLADATLPRQYGDPSRVSDMLVRLLAPRPRLRPTDDEAAAIRGALVAMGERVRARSEEIVLALGGRPAPRPSVRPLAT